MRQCEPELGAVLRQRQIMLETRIDSYIGTDLIRAWIPHDEGAKITEDAATNVGGTLEFDAPADRVWSPELRRETHALGDMGQQLHVTRYVVTGDGARHPIAMGWWRIIESPVEDGVVKVKAAERWDIASEYEFPAPMVPAAGSRWTALRDVLEGTVPQRTTMPAGLDDASGLDLIYDEDRVSAAYELITAMGGLARIDQNGVLQVIPDPPVALAMSFRDGVGGTVAERVPTLGAGAPNAFIVRSEPEGDDPPIQAISVLTTGPLRWNGPYGNRPEEYVSPLLTSYTQCKATADRLLARAVGRQNVVKVTTAPDPRLQIHDLVQLDWTPDSQPMTRSRLLVQSIDHPLTPDLMTFTGIEVN